jgi:hypothetical protein
MNSDVVRSIYRRLAFWHVCSCHEKGLFSGRNFQFHYLLLGMGSFLKNDRPGVRFAATDLVRNLLMAPFMERYLFIQQVLLSMNSSVATDSDAHSL